MFKSILVTLDGSEVSESVLPHVLKLAEGTDARVTLLTVAPPPEAMREGRISRRELLHSTGQFEHLNVQRTEVIHEGETESRPVSASRTSRFSTSRSDHGCCTSGGSIPTALCSSAMRHRRSCSTPAGTLT